MKNTKANIIKLLEAMSKHHGECQYFGKKKVFLEYAKQSSNRAIEIDNILRIITDNKAFSENWEIFVNECVNL